MLIRRRFVLQASGVAAALLLGRSDGAIVAAPPTARSIADADLKRAAERAELCSTSNAVGTGLRGEYFSSDLGHSRPALRRVDPTIDFDRSLDWPPNLGPLPASARWTGWVKPPYAGLFHFHAERGSARVVVARKLLVDASVSSGEGIHLAAGRFYPITMEAQRLDRLVERLTLEWTAPHGARYVVPRALLFLPTGEGS